MKVLVKSLILLFLGILIGIPLLYWVMVDDQPSVETSEKNLNHQNVARIKRLIKQNYPDPRRPKHFKFITILQDDLNLMMNYGMQRFLPGAATLRMDRNRAEVRASIRIPDGWPGQWLNIRTVLNSNDRRDLEIVALQLGSVSFPMWILQPVVNYLHKWGQGSVAEYRELVETIKTMRFEKERLILVYEWRPDLLKKIQAKSEQLLISKDERDRLVDYHNFMARQTRKFHGKKMELVKLLRPMFEFAQQRSQLSADPVAENRALLFVLAVYANGTNLRHVLSRQKGQGVLYAGYPRLTLQARRDLMQHYLISSGLSVSAGLGIADAVGLAKEISDSMGGTGFSFADLLADRAGVRFADLATRDKQTAIEVQRFMVRKELHENEFMPAITSLPEGLSEAEFKRRYKQVGSDEYNKIKTTIENRINACALFNAYAET